MIIYFSVFRFRCFASVCIFVGCFGSACVWLSFNLIWIYRIDAGQTGAIDFWYRRQYLCALKTRQIHTHSNTFNDFIYYLFEYVIYDAAPVSTSTRTRHWPFSFYWLFEHLNERICTTNEWSFYGLFLSMRIFHCASIRHMQRLHIFSKLLSVARKHPAWTEHG